MKSIGKRSALRRTCSLSRFAVTPYNAARSESSKTRWPRMTLILPTMSTVTSRLRFDDITQASRSSRADPIRESTDFTRKMARNLGACACAKQHGRPGKQGRHAPSDTGALLLHPCLQEHALLVELEIAALPFRKRPDVHALAERHAHPLERRAVRYR